MKGTALSPKTRQNEPQGQIQGITDLSWEELLADRERMVLMREQIDAALSEMAQIFLGRLQGEKISGKVIGNWSISKATRYNFKTTLAQARELGATKEAVDQSVLKQQHLQGIIVPGVEKTEYVMVREIEKIESYKKGGEKNADE